MQQTPSIFLLDHCTSSGLRGLELLLKKIRLASLPLPGVVCIGNDDKARLRSAPEISKSVAFLISTEDLVSNSIDLSGLYGAKPNSTNQNKLDVHTQLRNFLSASDISSIYFLNPDLSIPRSVLPVLFSEMADELDIDFFWPTRTPLKGRVAIYQNMFYRHSGIEKDYLQFLHGEKRIDRTGLVTFRSNYLNFKSNIHSRWFARHNARQLKKPAILGSAIRLQKLTAVKNIKNIWKNRKKTGTVRLLLPKHDHWYTLYANPELNDYDAIIGSVSKALPKSHRLLVKPHPREKYHPAIINTIGTLDNTELFNSDGLNFFDPVSPVIFFGTTAGVESLLGNSPVIELGTRSLAFNFPSPPVLRVINLSDLEVAIKQAITQPIALPRRESFLASLIENSVEFRPLEQNFFEPRFSESVLLDYILSHYQETNDCSQSR